MNLAHDVDYAIKPCRIILSIIGIRPHPKCSSILKRALFILHRGVCYLLFCFIVIPLFLHIVLIEKNLLKRLEMIGPFCYSASSAIKYSILLWRAEDVNECIDRARVDWLRESSSEHRSAMKATASVGRNLTICSISIMYGAGLLFRAILPLSRGTIVTSENITIRPLPSACYYGRLVVQISPLYEIAFALQFFAGYAIYSVTCCIGGLSAFLVMHVCGQLKVLAIKMENVVDGHSSENGSSTNRLASVVRHQMKVRSFLKYVENALEDVCFLEITVNAFLICLIGYYAIMEWENDQRTGVLTYLMLFASFCFNIFILCYIGELLIIQSDRVGATSSAIGWYRLPTKQMRNLVLIIAISNYPTKIRAGKLIDLSLPTFGNIIKTSMGYFNVLRKVIT